MPYGTFHIVFCNLFWVGGPVRQSWSLLPRSAHCPGDTGGHSPTFTTCSNTSLLAPGASSSTLSDWSLYFFTFFWCSQNFPASRGFNLPHPSVVHIRDNGCYRLWTQVPSLWRNLSSDPVSSKKTKAVLLLPDSKMAELSKSAHYVCDLLHLPPMQLSVERKAPVVYSHSHHPSLRTWSRKIKLVLCWLPRCCSPPEIKLIPFCWVEIQSYLW